MGEVKKTISMKERLERIIKTDDWLYQLLDDQIVFVKNIIEGSSIRQVLISGTEFDGVYQTKQINDIFIKDDIIHLKANNYMLEDIKVGAKKRGFSTTDMPHALFKSCLIDAGLITSSQFDQFTSGCKRELIKTMPRIEMFG